MNADRSLLVVMTGDEASGEDRQSTGERWPEPNAAPAGKNQAKGYQKRRFARQVSRKEQQKSEAGISGKKKEQKGGQECGVKQVREVVIVEYIHPEGHEENSGGNNKGSAPGPQQPGHQPQQRHQANDT